MDVCQVVLLIVMIVCTGTRSYQSNGIKSMPCDHEVL